MCVRVVVVALRFSTGGRSALSGELDVGTTKLNARTNDLNARNDELTARTGEPQLVPYRPRADTSAHAIVAVLATSVCITSSSARLAA